MPTIPELLVSIKDEINNLTKVCPGIQTGQFLIWDNGTDQAWEPTTYINIPGGDGLTPQFVIQGGTLSTPIVNGGIEFDGTKFWAAVGGVRYDILLGSGGGGVAGAGTLNYIAKWTPDGITLGDSSLFDTGTYVGLGNSNPQFDFDITVAGTSLGGVQVRHSANTSGRAQLGMDTTSGGQLLLFNDATTTGVYLTSTPGSLQYIKERISLGATGSNLIVEKVQVWGNVVPGVDNTYTLGNSTLGWSDLYLSSKIHSKTNLQFYNSTNSNTVTFFNIGGVTINAVLSGPGPELLVNGKIQTGDFQMTGQGPALKRVLASSDALGNLAYYDINTILISIWGVNTGDAGKSLYNITQTTGSPAITDNFVGIGKGLAFTATSRLDLADSSGYNVLRLRNSYTPTGITDVNGNSGNIAWDSNYLYLKTATSPTHNWMKIDLQTIGTPPPANYWTLSNGIITNNNAGSASGSGEAVKITNTALLGAYINLTIDPQTSFLTGLNKRTNIGGFGGGGSGAGSGAFLEMFGKDYNNGAGGTVGCGVSLNVTADDGDTYSYRTQYIMDTIGFGTRAATAKVHIKGSVHYNGTPLDGTFFIEGPGAGTGIPIFNVWNTLNIGVGTKSPAPSAIMDFTATNRAVLFTRLTTTQKNALTPVNGMIVYDSTLNKFQGYENGSWVSLI